MTAKRNLFLIINDLQCVWHKVSIYFTFALYSANITTGLYSFEHKEMSLARGIMFFFNSLHLTWFAVLNNTAVMISHKYNLLDCYVANG